MTKKISLLILLLLMVTNITGQQLNLSGRVFEQKDNKWVVYIIVFNDISKRPTEKTHQPEETTDFFIKK